MQTTPYRLFSNTSSLAKSKGALTLPKPEHENNTDTICAIATAPGRGGVGIVRVSGPKALAIAQASTQIKLTPRCAHFCDFHGSEGVIDQGIALYFQAPHSFTGEEVFEFQGHGGPVVLDLIVDHCLSLGARSAKPGEFSERAFLNNKIDLTQAEAIADLIDANSKQAAINALSSLRGTFAKHVHTLADALTELRIYVESAMDFPEEEVDFLEDGHILAKLGHLLEHLAEVETKAKQGAVIREGMHVVLAGEPNAGKSTLLNALAEQDLAIVTDIAGTTRDAITQHIHINGMPLHITDTAGIRDTRDKVEQIGIDRAWAAMHKADRILLLIDASTLDQSLLNEKLDSNWQALLNEPKLSAKLTLVINKVDLSTQQTERQPKPQSKVLLKDVPQLFLSAKHGQGLQALRDHLSDTMGISNVNEGGFSARRRHLDALKQCQTHLLQARDQLVVAKAGELVAEELRLAHNVLGEITGTISADDLLGKIFSSFCIGK